MSSHAGFYMLEASWASSLKESDFRKKFLEFVRFFTHLHTVLCRLTIEEVIQLNTLVSSSACFINRLMSPEASGSA